MDRRGAAFADGYLRPQVIGSPATVRARLEALLAETAADEVMAIASVPDAAARVRSFTLLAELAQLPAEYPVPGTGYSG